MIAPRRPPHSIDPSQRVVFYPTFGRQVQQGWEISLHAALFREGVDDYRRKIFLGLLRRVLKASREDFEQETFQQRITGFLLREQPGKRLAIHVGQQRLILAKRTRKSGHVRVKFTLPHQQIEQLTNTGDIQAGWLDFRAATLETDTREFNGSAQLVPAHGFSVISDIDDTLKHTGVRQRKLTLANTFFNHFQSIAGMETIYRGWASQGAVFHYVSSSPWQLYEPLQDLFQAEGYPRGSFHLKAIRFRDPTLLRLFIARRLPKRRAIESIIRAFPQRQFVLVGDSGEKDPEIYGRMARKYPAQIVRIFIRNVPERPLGIERSEKAFREMPPELCQVFRDPTEIDFHLPVPLTAAH